MPEDLSAAIAEAHRNAEVVGRAQAALDAAGFDTDRVRIAVSSGVVLVVCAGLDAAARDRAGAVLAGEPDLAGYRIRVDDDEPDSGEDPSANAAVAMMFELSPGSAARAASSTGQRCHDAGDLTGAEHWWRRAAGHGDEEAMQSFRILLRDQGRAEEAAALFDRWSAAGRTAATHQLGVCRFEQGRYEQAEAAFGRAVEAGRTGSATTCGVMWLRAGEPQRARPWLVRASRLGDDDADRLLALMD